MKLEKLYTLSQFVDLLTSPNSIISGGRGGSSQQKLYLIYKYNLFLKQPLKKEMFVNKIDKPKGEDFENNLGEYEMLEVNLYQDALKSWQEAEKKVIFKDVTLIGNVIICKEENLFINESCRYDSFQELVEITNGKLKLKNVEI